MTDPDPRPRLAYEAYIRGLVCVQVPWERLPVGIQRAWQRVVVCLTAPEEEDEAEHEE